MIPPAPQFEYSEKRSWWARHGVTVSIIAVALTGLIVLVKVFRHADAAPVKKAAEMVMIKPVAPPPPPPPPPPQQQVQPKEQMMEQTPVDEAETKPDAPAPDAGPEIGTNVAGNGGPDAFGLGGNKRGTIGGGGGGRANSSRFGWYANLVDRAVSDALRQNGITRIATFNIKARIWADATGRVTRAKMESTGDPAVDRAIKNTVLANFQLPEPPPEGMPMPVVMRFTARRPD